MKSDTKPDVCVVGLGYIGLPTAAVIARAGCQVLGLDVSQTVVDTINRGEIHIEEVDLDGLVQGVVSRGLLSASTEIAPADVFVIAVPTPFDKNHAPDISYVLAAGRSVAAVLKAGDVVILESTSPVGTTDKLRDLIAELRPDLKIPGLTRDTPDVSIAYCPERVLPGRILEELTNNDRSIGGITPRCARKALAFYKRFVRGECVTTDARSAEMTKLVENAYRDVNIAFANELSMVADRMGLDVWEVIRLANRHPRVNILTPGPGVGGHCIAVDPWFIVHGAPEETPLIRTARGVNDHKMSHVIAKAEALVEAHPEAKVACLGLAFKANIDDFRESPARFVTSRLARKFGSRIHIVEPYAAQLPIEFTDTGAVQIDIDDALETCEILIVLVDHDVFRVVPLAERSEKLVYDTRGIWPDQPRVVREAAARLALTA
ncbi:MAG: UDP-N-acetyl-D-mannosaminuronic acid dehydrogenase [Novosphingobium lindaniclasticum]|jgi:UDP-N-acetyl-D-mannosaminuronic acid dehydrogenase|uniref:UDP-N-acetyl-D-mannosamine dehydrogenase n=1 Tax=Novosphingobium lindaniclasticum LE124 TaxID=1096930 RepID=T0HHV8_9SPHN|nr:UDP-N-acetyl-D-mannosamine dehydrogenase [Novosphingobium lindaniclasticum]EQB15886.1 UDP-N-acetyl-D-mannosamine dehydrogenase [Novosphingobium lindaniclasticum LE124]MDF2639375.1 UDP-N-acetyl-D-mannosaminuronic acid dehydrogenase [Novosphingobium lindaniclasticum]